MYEKDLAQCLGHSRCSINVRVPFFFYCSENNDERYLKQQRCLRISPSPLTPLPGEKGRSQLITSGGWGGGVRLESLLALFAASLFH